PVDAGDEPGPATRGPRGRLPRRPGLPPARHRQRSRADARAVPSPSRAGGGETLSHPGLHPVAVPLPPVHRALRAAVHVACARARHGPQLGPGSDRPALRPERGGRAAVAGDAGYRPLAWDPGRLADVSAGGLHSRPRDGGAGLPVRPQAQESRPRAGRRVARPRAAAARSPGAGRVVRHRAHHGADALPDGAPGTALQQLLRQGHDPAGPLRLTARAVAAFNQDDLGSGDVSRSPLAVQLEELRRGASIVEWARPQLATEVRAITAAVAAGLEEVPPAAIHGDLKPDHVFLAGDEVIFIDLDSVVLGD